MANGFDRLERLFTKRKASAVSNESSGSNSPTEVLSLDQKFPSPSFIRPKAARMAARDEVRIRRTPMLPRTPSPQRGNFDSQDLNQRPYSSERPASSRNTHSQTLVLPQPFSTTFRDFEFPRPPTHSGELSPASSIRVKPSFGLIGQRSPRSRSPHKPVTGPPRIDTPPASDPEDEDPFSFHYFRNKKLPELPSGAPPTPERSPKLCPARNAQLSESKSIDILNKAVYQDIRRQLGETYTKNCPPRRAMSQSSLTPSTSMLSVGSSTLREPDFDEFFSLKDDDIAEDDLESIAPEAPLGSASASKMPQSQSLLTLSPPHASRPATAAAFEAARIAKRYNFDLVYVVNLWPEGTKLKNAGSDQDDSASSTSDICGKSSTGMSGRLLAAYGLHNVKSPFQISAAVHSKILRSEGWIEYRNQTAQCDEFSRGYACSFYTGRYSRSNSVASAASTFSTKQKSVDRGIVFAAYRKPKADGSMHGVKSDQSELANVHRDAEALVEMLIDIHVANRQRQPHSNFNHSDETGPMPV